MKPIEDLKMEHEAVKIILRVLDSICKEAEKSGELANPEHLEQLIEFFTTFVDRCHHGKEEELLFPALEEVGVSREGGPIGVMLKEHQQGRDAVAKMKASLVKYRDGDRKAVGDLVHHARAYITLLNQHIDKENNVLFVLADNNLSKEKQMELWEGFETIETQKIGPGKHEAFHQMIESLESIYLS
ncbi:MAG: hemerythrin domain-containing protein [Deltaproteobacteria bacterium]|nr:hemerythrin domain-containing protein [Deltaproteobacteria bacterium]